MARGVNKIYKVVSQKMHTNAVLGKSSHAFRSVYVSESSQFTRKGKCLRLLVCLDGKHLGQNCLLLEGALDSSELSHSPESVSLDV